jgi:branched-chain amino acid transport system permease protein
MMPQARENLLLLQVARRTFGGLVAVNDVSFKVRMREIAGLIGRNGAGKSTIFDLVTGVLRPTAGAIVFKGERIGGTSRHCADIPKRQRAAQHECT